MVHNDTNSSKLRGIKIEIYPDENQKIFIKREIERYTWVYNWAIEQQEKYRKNGGKKLLSLNELSNRFSDIRKSIDWLADMNIHTARYAIMQMQTAYKNMFIGICNHPRFKTKKDNYKSFHVRNEPYAFNINENGVRISGMPLKDRILCKNTPTIPKNDNIKFYNCTISFDGYRYWLSVNIEIDKNIEFKKTEFNNKSIGIDLGYKTLAQLSTGKQFNWPNKLLKLEKRRRRQQRRVAKMQNLRRKKAEKARTKLEEIPLTKNEEKIKYNYYKTRQKMMNIKNTFMHQMTTEIVNMFPKRIVMETLNPSSMNPGYKYKFYGTNNFYKIANMIEYKCIDRNIEFVKANIHFPSTQLCSNCGFKQKIGVKRIYECPICGLKIDRDLNSSINLSNYLLQ